MVACTELGKSLWVGGGGGATEGRLVVSVPSTPDPATSAEVS